MLVEKARRPPDPLRPVAGPPAVHGARPDEGRDGASGRTRALEGCCSTAPSSWGMWELARKYRAAMPETGTFAESGFPSTS